MRCSMHLLPAVALLDLVVAGGASAAFAVSHANGHVAQQQPPPDSCHVHGQYPFNMPDRHCTPGAEPGRHAGDDPKDDLPPGYSSSIRSSTSVTEPEKLASIRAYGFDRRPSAYEYDHLISLELGGAANDSRNLWPEPGASANRKEKEENYLHARVRRTHVACRAQRIIALDWVSFYKQNLKPKPPPPPGPPDEASCTPARSARRQGRPATPAPAHRWCVAERQTVATAGIAGRAVVVWTDLPAARGPGLRPLFTRFGTHALRERFAGSKDSYSERMRRTPAAENAVEPVAVTRRSFRRSAACWRLADCASDDVPGRSNRGCSVVVRSPNSGSRRC